MIWQCPSVRFLDYERVLDKERQEAKELLGTVDEPSDIAAKVGLNLACHITSD